VPSRRLAAAQELLAAAPEELRALPRRWRRAGVAIAAIAAAAFAIGIIVAAGLPGSSPAASSTKKVAGATTVQRRDLVATDTESGTLTYASPETVFNRLSGTITWLPTVGQLVKPGQTVYQVDGQPVVLFSGTTPAYRDLTSGVSDGPDVLELNRDLVNMGFDPGHEITVNNSWQAGTTDAVERWQASVGESQTGTISLGQVVFLPGPQRITSVNTVLGSTGGSGAGSGSSAGSSSGAGAGSSSGAGSGATSGSGSASGAAATAAPGAEFVSLTTKTAGARGTSASAGGAGTADRAAAVMDAWNSACAAHDLQRLESLKQRHPNVLASLQPSSCAPPPPPQGQTTGPAVRTDPAPDSTPVQASRITPSPVSTTPTTSTAPTTSGGKPAGGSGRKTSGKTATNAAVLKALEALLKAETLELQKSAGSAGRGGASAPSAGAASGAGRLSSSSSAGVAGGASSAGGGAAAGGGGGGAGSSGSGSTANAQPTLGTTSTQLNVVVNLDATKQSEARVGEPVTVQMPDGSVVDGKITQVSPVAQSSSGNGSSNGSSSGSGSNNGGSGSSAPTSTVPVTIALHGRLPASGLDQAAVSVNFEQQVERGVMSVPVTALLATAGGGYAVQEAAPPHRLIPVTPGLFAAGYVQISSSQIHPGLQVTDSQG
jgi:hypothetical protein